VTSTKHSNPSPLPRGRGKSPDGSAFAKVRMPKLLSMYGDETRPTCKAYMDISSPVTDVIIERCGYVRFDLVTVGIAPPGI
jgi:hypothetical protein